MVIVASCNPAVKIVTINFKVLGNFAGDGNTTSLNLDAVSVNPPAGYIGTTISVGDPITIVLELFYDDLSYWVNDDHLERWYYPNKDWVLVDPFTYFTEETAWAYHDAWWDGYRILTWKINGYDPPSQAQIDAAYLALKTAALALEVR
jgi:hypothetical protein